MSVLSTTIEDNPGSSKLLQAAPGSATAGLQMLAWTQLPSPTSTHFMDMLILGLSNHFFRLSNLLNQQLLHSLRTTFRSLLPAF